MKKAILFLLLSIATTGSYARCWMYCSGSGQQYIVNDHNTGDKSRWEYTTDGGCHGGPWVIEVSCYPTPVPDGNGGYTDGHGNQIDEATTYDIASNFAIANIGNGTPSGAEQDFLYNAIANNTFVKVYVDGSQFTTDVEAYFMANNPAGYPPAN